MTDDELDFYRAAAAAPDDDTPRLVYADWLDDRGTAADSARAAFVRLQVRRTRLDPSDPDRDSLLAEEAALFARCRRAWNGPTHRRLFRLGLPRKVDARGGLIRGWDYRRGMPARVTLEPAALLDHPDAVFAVGPVECLRFVRWNVPAAQLARVLPLLRRVRMVVWAGIEWRSLPDTPRGDHGQSIPLLDLCPSLGFYDRTRMTAWVRAQPWFAVVLFHTHDQQSRRMDWVIDPHGRWPSLQRWYFDMTGRWVEPRPYQPTT